MTREEVFSVWAPPESIWSPWVAPVLFAQTYWDTREMPEQANPQEIPWLGEKMTNSALIVDLPGADSVKLGFALAARGFRPVPLYNASPGPEEMVGLGMRNPGISNAVIDMGSVVDAISDVTTSLKKKIALSAGAPPAFLLDSMRLVGNRPASKGMFDNRWMVIPQDFPSANFLLSHGVSQALLIQTDRLEPLDDLAHTLLRWQEGGISVFAKKLNDDLSPSRISVRRPSKYKAIWYRALAQLGFRRSSGGGFGSYIPETTGAG